MVARSSRANLDRESVRVRPPSAPDPPFFGECNASEDATEVKAQREQDQPNVGPCLTHDIDGHAKPDQHGRGRCDFGCSSAHPPGGQAFLRRRRFAILGVMEEFGQWPIAHHQTPMRNRAGRVQLARRTCGVGQAGGESVSQSLLKDKVFSTFLNQNPQFELTEKRGFCARQKPVPPNGPSSTTVPSSD